MPYQCAECGKKWHGRPREQVPGAIPRCTCGAMLVALDSALRYEPRADAERVEVWVGVWVEHGFEHRRMVPVDVEPIRDQERHPHTPPEARYRAWGDQHGVSRTSFLGATRDGAAMRVALWEAWASSREQMGP